MYTRPNLADLIEGVVISLNKDVMPDLQSPKAMVAVQIIQGVLANVAQRAEAELPAMLVEHNEMVALYGELAELLGDTPGPEADRIRGRATTLGAMAPVPTLPARQEIDGAYHDLSAGLCDTIDDLDILIREGSEAAGEALLKVRAHTGPRSAREFAANVAGVGMVGRG